MLLGVKARSGIAQAAALVTGLTAVSAVLGFFRDVVIAGVFGAGGRTGCLSGGPGTDEPGAGARRRRHGESDRAGAGRAERHGRRLHKSAHTLSVVLTVTLVVLGLGSLIMALAASSVVTVLAPASKAHRQTSLPR